MSQRVVCVQCHKMFPTSVKTYICVFCQATFCEKCKQDIVKKRACPACGKYLGNDDIKVNRMNFEEQGIIRTGNLCIFHKYELTFYCTNCKKYCCVQCVKEEHRNCRVIEERSVMDEQKPEIMEFIKWIKKTRDKLEEINKERERRVDEYIAHEEKYLDLLLNKIQNKIKQQKSEYLEEQIKKLNEKFIDVVELRNRIFFNSLGYDLNKPCDKDKEELVLKYKDYISKSLVYNQNIYKTVNIKDLVPNFEKEKRIIKFEKNKTLLHESFKMLDKPIELNLDKKGIYFDLVLNVMGLPNQNNDPIDLLDYCVQVSKGRMDIFFVEGHSKNGQIEAKEFIPCADIQYDAPYILKIKLRYSSYTAKLLVERKVFTGIQKNAISKDDILKYDKILQSKPSKDIDPDIIPDVNKPLEPEKKSKNFLHKSALLPSEDSKKREGKNYFENFEKNYREIPGFTTDDLENRGSINDLSNKNEYKKKKSNDSMGSAGNYAKKNSNNDLRRSQDSKPPFSREPDGFYQNNINNKYDFYNQSKDKKSAGNGPNNMNEKKNNTSNYFNRPSATTSNQNNFNRTYNKTTGAKNYLNKK